MTLADVHKEAGGGVHQGVRQDAARGGKSRRQIADSQTARQQIARQQTADGPVRAGRGRERLSEDDRSCGFDSGLDMKGPAPFGGRP